MVAECFASMTVLVDGNARANSLDRERLHRLALCAATLTALRWRRRVGGGRPEEARGGESAHEAGPTEPAEPAEPTEPTEPIFQNMQGQYDRGRDEGIARGRGSLLLSWPLPAHTQNASCFFRNENPTRPTCTCQAFQAIPSSVPPSSCPSSPSSSSSPATSNRCTTARIAL